MALSLYVGLGFFFAMNALALLRGASVMTAMSRGLLGLVVFAVLGFIARLAVRTKGQSPVDSRQEEVGSGQ
jgi:hypothetical protein